MKIEQQTDVSKSVVRGPGRLCRRRGRSARPRRCDDRRRGSVTGGSGGFHWVSFTGYHHRGYQSDRGHSADPEERMDRTPAPRWPPLLLQVSPHFFFFYKFTGTSFFISFFLVFIFFKKFWSSLRYGNFALLVRVWASKDTTFLRTFFRAVSVHIQSGFQSSFRAVSEQLYCNFGTVSGKFFFRSLGYGNFCLVSAR